MDNIFTKMCAAGNDFLIADSIRPPHVEAGDWIAQIPKLCHRKFGIGADGVCFLSASETAHLNWQFFNKDGSQADMCGNAACCIIHYAYKKNLVSKDTSPLTFKIKDRILSGVPGQDNKACLYSPLPKLIEKQTAFGDIHYSKVNAGALHILIEHDQTQNWETLRELAKKLRQREPDFNVTFYKRNASGIFCVTFERGVEDFTLSCGTGALAVAFLLGQKFIIETRGGMLEVSLEKDRACLISPVFFYCRHISI